MSHWVSVIRPEKIVLASNAALITSARYPRAESVEPDFEDVQSFGLRPRVGSATPRRRMLEQPPALRGPCFPGCLLSGAGPESDRPIGDSGPETRPGRRPGRLLRRPRERLEGRSSTARSPPDEALARPGSTSSPRALR